MHPELEALYEGTVAHFRADPRVIGGWMFGSLSRGEGDAFSDVDPVFVVRAEHFDAVDAELRPLLERLSPGEVVLWWPEGFNDASIRNYAALIRLEDGDIIQYDMTIVPDDAAEKGGFWRVFAGGCTEESIIFDESGAVHEMLAGISPAQTQSRSPVWTIEQYWIYAYINVKYARRADAIKLLYAQEQLFHAHLDVLRALYGLSPDWWTQSMKALPEEKRANLLLYFGANEPAALIENFREELARFGKDARDACAAHNVEYPGKLEADILAYIDKHL